MDPFWAPLAVYTGLLIVGGLLAACGAPLAESHDRDKKQIANVFFGLGGAVAMMGGGGIVVKLIGELIEAIF